MIWIRWPGAWGSCGFCGRKFSGGELVAELTAHKLHRCASCARRGLLRAVTLDPGEDLELEASPASEQFLPAGADPASPEAGR